MLPFSTLPSSDLIILILGTIILAVFMLWLKARAVKNTKAEAYDTITFLIQAKEARETPESTRPSNFWLSIVLIPIMPQHHPR
jgi:hypothetical protein